MKLGLSLNSRDQPLAAMPSFTTSEPSRRLSSATAVVHSPTTTVSKLVMIALPAEHVISQAHSQQTSLQVGH